MTLLRRAALSVLLVTLAACKTAEPASGTLEGGAACNAAVSSTSCDYYDCLEGQAHCGDAGYPKAYGKRYCTVFLGRCGGQLPDKPAMNSWLTGTAKCLQAKLDTFTTAPQNATLAGEQRCSAIETEGFKTHGYCYTSGAVAFGGTSFCSLAVSDWYAVRACIDGDDRASTRGLAQIVETGARCAPLFGGLFGLTAPQGDEPVPPEIAAMSPQERAARAVALARFLDETEAMLAERR